MASPIPPASTDNQGNINAIFSSVRSLLIVIGTILAAKGLSDSGLYFWIESIAGSIMVVGPAVWGVYSAVSTYIATKAKVTQAVNAGIAVGSVSGPSLVSTDTAHAIVKSYAANEVATTDALNAAQLQGKPQ